MKMALKYTTLLLALGLCAQTGLAQSGTTTGSSTGSATQKSNQASGQYHRMSNLIGAKVQSAQGENLGDIKDVVVNQKGQIQFAVLGMGGFLGLGEKLTPVPWSMLQSSGEKTFSLNADKAKLQAAPTIDSNQWSQFDSQQYTSQIYSYYGVSPEAVGGTGASQYGTEGGTEQKSDTHEKDMHEQDQIGRASWRERV